MSWVKLDDHFVDNSKVAGLSNGAFRLHVTALCHAASQLTDGMIAKGVVRKLGWASENLDTDVSELLQAGIWEKADKGFRIHDYLEYNPSKEEVERTREERSEAGRRGGLAKAQQIAKQKSGNLLSKEPSKTEAKPKQNSAPNPYPFPYPSDNNLESDQSLKQQQQTPTNDKTLVVVAFEALQILSSSHQAILEAFPEVMPADVYAWGVYLERANAHRRNGNRLTPAFVVGELKARHRAPEDCYLVSDPDDVPVMVLE